MTDWPAFARVTARKAYHHHFEYPWAALYVEDLDVLVVYSDNPSARDRKLQDAETSEFRRRLAAEGIGELAYATWPPPGHEDIPEGGGYADALVINASRDRGQWVAETMLDIACATSARLDRELEHTLAILRELLKRNRGESPDEMA
jgi:hypothetical protein